MAELEFHRSFWEDFINLYRSFPCLWDVSARNYSDKQARNAAYGELVKKCQEKFPGATKDFVTKKIHHFRCAYRRELRKVRSWEKCPRGSPYKPTLWYFDLLDFIRYSVITRRPKRKIASALEESEGDQEEEENDLHNHTSEQNDDDDSLPATEAEHLLSAPKDPACRKEKLDRKKEELLELAYSTLCSSQKDDDEFVITGKKLACQLKGMNEQQRFIAEKLMSDIIFYGRLGKLTENSVVHLSPPYYPPVAQGPQRQSQHNELQHWMPAGNP